MSNYNYGGFYIVIPLHTSNDPEIKVAYDAVMKAVEDSEFLNFDEFALSHVINDDSEDKTEILAAIQVLEDVFNERFANQGNRVELLVGHHTNEENDEIDGGFFHINFSDAYMEMPVMVACATDMGPIWPTTVVTYG